MFLRPYQTDAIDALFAYFERAKGNPVVAKPTGTGKSIVIAELIRRIFEWWPTQRVMMLTHVQELIEQNFAELTGLWPLAPAGIYSAGLSRKEVRPITFAGIQSVVGKADLFGIIDLVLIDECHLVSPKQETSYQNFIADLLKINPRLKVVGFTATPYRLGQGLLTNPIETAKGPRPSLFSDICYDITGMEAFNRLIEQGYLCNLIPKRTTTKIDISNVGTSMGEFNLDELQAAVDKMEITRKAIDEMIQVTAEMPHSSGRPRCRWLIFATGIEHVEHVTTEFLERGMNARSVTSKTASIPRKETIAWFKEETEDVRVLVNNGVLTTGFNCRQLDTEGILRPTNSPGLWVQILGRGTRPYEGKDNCLVFDFAGNSKRLGPINDPIIPRRRGQKGGGEAPVKVCPACGTYNHASVRFCICCNAEFPKSFKVQETASTNELVRGSSPQVEEFKVTHVTYDVHTPRDAAKAPSLKAVYYCGSFRTFSEWVCLEHSGMVGGLARKWWKRASGGKEPPASIEAAVARQSELQMPKNIRVHLNQRHPRVVGYDYTGTEFSGLLQKVAVA